MATIRMQNIGGNLYPMDALSAGTLEKEFGIGRIPGGKAWMWTARIVGQGHRIAITGGTKGLDM